MFGKMLKKAPYMLHLDAPSTAEEKRNAISRVEHRNTATSGNHIACNSLQILQLLSSLDLPDLDKVVRSQPLLLLADIQEVNARVDFLLTLCNEIKPFQLNRASPPEHTSLHEKVDSSSKPRDLSLNLDNPSCLTKDRIGMSTPPVLLTSSPSSIQSVDSRSKFSGLEAEAGAMPIAVTCEDRIRMELVGDSGVGRHISFPPSNSRQPATAPQAAGMSADGSLSQSQEGKVEVELPRLDVDSSAVPAMSSRSESSEVAVESRHQDMAALSKDALEPNHVAARKILGSLLLSYPGVLSIESRYELLYLFTAHPRHPVKAPLTLDRHHVN